MSNSKAVACLLMEDCGEARAHFEAWWTLRSIAIPEFVDTMNDYGHVDFFLATSLAHYKCFFISLGRIFDRDTRASGISTLKRMLREEGNAALAEFIEGSLSSHTETIQKVMGIRSRAIAHGEHGANTSKVHETYGVTPNEIRAVIDSACEMINEVLKRMGETFGVSDGERMQRATLHMLHRLRG